MGMRFALVLTVFLAIVAVNSVLADSEGKVLDSAKETNGGNDKKEVITEEKKGKDQAGDGSKGAGESNSGLVGNGEQGKVGGNDADSGKKKTGEPGPKEKTDSGGDSKQLGSEGTGNGQKKKEDEGADNKSNGDTKSKDKGSKPTGNEQSDGTGSEMKKTKNADSELEKKKEKSTGKDGETKEKTSGGSNIESKDSTLVQGRKEGGEACDSSSNSCTIKDKSIVACLRVPGNESPDLSLLIQNKGKEPVTVTITAPDFVKLDQKQIRVKENSNEKVMVSIGSGGTDSKITLKTGNGNCMLDFKEMITQTGQKNPGFAQLVYINRLKNTPYVWFILLAAVLIIASVWIGIGFRRKYVAKNSSAKYEKLEMELPISAVSKTSPDSNDGWDDNWDDDGWDDDEEIAMPASSPVTPSFSSNGISSRRVIKDAWKD